jgi:hypothetical protein
MSQQLIQALLNEVSSGDLDESLDRVLKYLENKHDPEPTELKLVESLYEFIEKRKSLESDIRNHVNLKQRKLSGNKLVDLYDREPKHVGTQNLFDL